MQTRYGTKKQIQIRQGLKKRWLETNTRMHTYKKKTKTQKKKYELVQPTLQQMHNIKHRLGLPKFNKQALPQS